MFKINFFFIFLTLQIILTKIIHFSTFGIDSIADGSNNLAYKSINLGVSMLNDGDSLLFQDGIYPISSKINIVLEFRYKV